MGRFRKCFLFFLLWAIAVSVYAATPWLHADGNQLKDPAGSVVILRGVSIADLGGTEKSFGGAVRLIDRLTDKTDCQGASPGWYPRVIRLPIYPLVQEEYDSPFVFESDPNEFYNHLLRPVVDYCRLKGLYVIIDWHYIDNTYDHRETTSRFWRYIAPRFSADSHVIFELFNEPINNTAGSETDNWLSVRKDMQVWIDLVRQYAPRNLILVAGPNWSQAIGPAAAFPLRDPVGNNNIAMVAHLYPEHWRQQAWYQKQIETCHAVYPVFMTEWGFSQSASPDPNAPLNGTISNYGRPLTEWMEQRGISYTAWVANYDWRPPMFDRQWKLRCGEGEMGGFVKDLLYAKRQDHQPQERGEFQGE